MSFVNVPLFLVISLPPFESFVSLKFVSFVSFDSFVSNSLSAKERSFLFT